ncbi:uncharacterized protein GIQ15_02833 [Arthroderma uncinatum]|uniref:uncharacterized protein n=1 Tax=Arthroderma uncinatum TaxID=74035 RepID=UPI00144A9C56|nr:uncharacterized protein GIQ15_02833 [Arthroderma uncinatum]KAF3483509.1 hypothetical protein GIQ15_02833 [Arthroderma uncinatum]
MHRSIPAKRLALSTQPRPATGSFVRFASSRPKRAPSTIRAERRDSPRISRSVSPLPGQFGPGDQGYAVRRLPLELYLSAHKEGLITIGVREASKIARECIELAAELKAQTEEVVLTERIHTDIDKISQTLFVLLRSPYYARLALWFLPHLAKQGDVRSSYYLSHVKSKASRQADSLSWPDNPTEPLQAVIIGQGLLDKGDLENAARRFKQAMDISKPVDKPESFDALFPTSVQQPWEAYGSVMQSLGQQDAAKEAYSVGATQYDNSRAYKLLLQDILQSGDLVKYEEYLTKVAMGNDIPACYQLGNLYLTLYLMKSDSKESKPGGDKEETLLESRYTKDESQKLAIEWYEIAVAGGHAQAALVMAGLLRQQNKREQGLRYLQIAEANPNYSERAAGLRGSWQDEQFTFDIKDLMR